MGISSGEQAERLSRPLSGEENLTTGVRGHNPEDSRSPIPAHRLDAPPRLGGTKQGSTDSWFLGRAPFFPKSEVGSSNDSNPGPQKLLRRKKTDLRPARPNAPLSLRHPYAGPACKPRRLRSRVPR
jgi:hypothetical protein